MIHTAIFPAVPDQFEEQLAHIKKGQPSTVESTSENIFFDFDPNTATINDLEELGFSEKAIQHIYNYRNKGGVFYSRDDLLKINDITTDEYFKIRKHIKIQRTNNYRSEDYSSKTAKIILDINKADSSQYTDLKGIGPVLASRIIKYRNSIGGFTSVEQLSKVYGVEPELVDKLRPFLLLSNVPVSKVEEKVDEAAVRLPKMLLDLNKADTIELTSLKGIGPTYSRRIFKYRDLLGGFVHKDQLKEVYGLPVETIEAIASNIIIEPDNVRKMNINKATFQELVAHPYINKLVAEYIVKHRNANHFTAIAEIKNSFLVDEELFRKIAPYLEI